MTGSDAAGPIPGYFDSPFPGEDGGPRRQLAPRAAAGRLESGQRGLKSPRHNTSEFLQHPLRRIAHG